MTNTTDKLAATIISYLKSAGQLESLPGVVAALSSSLEYKKAQHHVTVTSAVKLDATELKAIESYVQKQVGRDYTFTNAINPSLIAGFTLQINDTLVDASFLGKITTVQNSLHTKD